MRGQQSDRWLGSAEHHSAAGRPSREAVFARLGVQVRELWQRMGGLPTPVEARGIWRGLWFEEAHHSTTIEGNTLVLKQVEALLERAEPSATESWPTTWKSRAAPTPRTGSASI